MIPTPTTIFLDRDGTIIRDVRYLSRADDVELLPGAAHAIARLNNIGTPVVVVTNQSGIARGRFTIDDYLQTKQRLDELLAASGARINATYFCADHPDFTGPCDCRKPGTRLFEQAAMEHRLNMRSPAFIGDRWRDVEPYHSLGGTPVLINGSETPVEDVASAHREGVTIVSSLPAAVDVLIGAEDE